MVKIRDCGEGDFEPVFRLLEQLWPDRELDRAALADVFRHNLALDDQHYLCAESAGEVVGFSSLSVRKSLWGQGFIAYLDELVVDEGRRGEGIGTRLLERSLALAAKDGCRRVELDSAFHREDAHLFYEKHGFQKACLLFTKEL